MTIIMEPGHSQNSTTVAVWVPDRDTEAEVVAQTNSRSYQVVTPEGEYGRNRIALRPLPVQQTNNGDLQPEPVVPENVPLFKNRHDSLNETETNLPHLTRLFTDLDDTVLHQIVLIPDMTLQQQQAGGGGGGGGEM